MSDRQQETLRELIARYDLRFIDVAEAAGVTHHSLYTALDRDTLRGLRPTTRKRYERAIQKVRKDIMRRVAVA